GAERQAYEIAKRIDRDKFELFLFILHQENIPAEFAELGISLSGLGIKRIYGLDGLRKGITFRNVLRNEKIDILMTFHFASDVWGTVFGKMAGVKAIISSRRDIGFWRKPIHILAYKCVNRWVSKIIAVSAAVKRMVVEEEGVSEGKIVVIHNGVDLSRSRRLKASRSQVRKNLGIGENDKIVCHVGNFNSETKGQAVLIEAAGIVLENRGSKIEDRRDVKFLFVGEGLLLERMKSEVRRRKAEENIIFLGKRSDVAEILAASDVCVLPSLSEGLSNALLEYMAAGRAVVATAVGGNTEVIKDGANGLLVPSGDPVALALAIGKLLNAPPWAAELGCHAQATVMNQFDIDAQIKELLEFLADEYSASHKQ
ncbi:MAG: glycosyltransferase, partial [Candidatus Omnitrophica bacterium]|nr:glycosyltransferase [Candidatus Omnitrophota bacterium]